MKKYILTQQDREDVFNFLKNHGLMSVRNLLSQLPESKEDNLAEFLDEVKKLVRNTGRSSMISVGDIEKLIVEFGGKSFTSKTEDALSEDAKGDNSE